MSFYILCIVFNIWKRKLSYAQKILRKMNEVFSSSPWVMWVGNGNNPPNLLVGKISLLCFS